MAEDVHSKKFQVKSVTKATGSTLSLSNILVWIISKQTQDGQTNRNEDFTRCYLLFIAMGKDSSGTPCDLTLRSFTVVHGNWGTWSSWEPCTVTCGVGQTGRSRVCDSPAPRNGGLYCGGESYEIRFCEIAECPQQQQPGNGGCGPLGRTIVRTVGLKTGL